MKLKFTKVQKIMTKNLDISTSPDRDTFQLDCYIKNQQERDLPVDDSIIQMYKDIHTRKIIKESTSEWREYSLEYDLRSTQWILEKVRNSDSYAKDLYAALCNNDFIKLDLWSILKERKWSCSWRYSGGIIAHMRREGDYIDWYCAGDEGTVTGEIKEDFKQLGWTIPTIDITD